MVIVLLNKASWGRFKGFLGKCCFGPHLGCVTLLSVSRFGEMLGNQLSVHQIAKNAK